MPQTNNFASALALGLLIHCPWSYAAHPLISEDPFVQGRDQHQLELNTDKTLSPLPLQGLSNLTYTYGLNDSLDLFINFSGRYSAPTAQGDSIVGFKYQINNNDQSSWGIKGMLSWPSGNYRKQLGGEQKQLAINLVHSLTQGDFNLLSNATVVLKRSVQASPQGNTQLSLSQAFIYTPCPSLKLLIDTGVRTNEQKELSQWTKQFVVGAIYSPVKNFDLDLGLNWQQQNMGWQRSLGAGLTWRF